ncbi:MAG: DUF4325 domain-containing protein [Bdellovibrionales bacterium]|nr:DUF4325 domain-containing protein [Bdellovibrionales bacterium]
MDHFSVTRTTVHRHLNTLIKKEQIVKTGRTQATQYFLKSSFNKKLNFSLKKPLNESQVWEKYLKSSFTNFKTNIQEICVYGFTEMFNNVIDHSQASRAYVELEKDQDKIIIKISDDGIGVFKNIKEHFNLSDVREAVFQLTKGKLTTDPQRHSGEGVFFSSRCFDEFSLSANGICYLKDNTANDWYLEDLAESSAQGTTVQMIISEASSRRLEDIFFEYQNEDSLAFDKTHIVVRFSKLPEENFISRSQAKRVLHGLNKFERVILDFEGVKGVGQGFVDEIFRVYSNNHPHINFKYINANKSVEMMIERCKATSKLNQN